MNDYILELKEVTKRYALGETTVTALDGVSIAFQRGDFVVIAGPSGSGKSTLLNIMGCIDKPSTGQVILDGEDVTDIGLERLTKTRLHKLGFIFQTFNLVPVLTAYENVELPLLFKIGDAEEMRRRTTVVLQRVGLGDRMAHRPSKLSGGQRQRVAIARALAGQPRVILADEPTANLDSRTAASIVDLLLELNEEEGVTILIASHDQSIIDKARKVVTIHDGKMESYAEC